MQIFLDRFDVTVAKFKQSDSTVSKNYEEKEKFQLWNKSSDLCGLNTLTHYDKTEEKEYDTKRRIKADSSNILQSTLSLHISAYENSFKASSDSFDNNEEFNNEKLGSKKKDAKQVFSASTFDIQNPFEFPRQHNNNNNNNVSNPEVSQFKASQRLLNPNRTSNGSQQKTKSFTFEAALGLLDEGHSSSNYFAADNTTVVSAATAGAVTKSTNFFSSKAISASTSQSMSSATSEETSDLVSMLEDIVTQPSSFSGPGYMRSRRLGRRPNKCKRPALSNVTDELVAKKAKVQYALASNKGSTTFVFPKPELNIPGGVKSKLQSSISAPPAIPVIAKLSPANTFKKLASSTSNNSSSTNNRNSIHGRKTISIREQQEKQIGRAQEVINRLKTEQKNKASSPQVPQRPRPSIPNKHDASTFKPSSSLQHSSNLKENQSSTFKV